MIGAAGGLHADQLSRQSNLGQERASLIRSLEGVQTLALLLFPKSLDMSRVRADEDDPVRDRKRIACRQTITAAGASRKASSL